MERMLPELAVADAQAVDSNFVDYKRFEGDSTQRAEERDRFFRGEVWAPGYDYPKLDELYDFMVDEDMDEEAESFLMDRKAAIQRAIYRLELAKEQGEMDPNEAELYANFHELRLKKIMLIEAARRLRGGNGAEQAVARAAYMELNAELYGEFDGTTYMGMLRTERDRLEAFEPANETAAEVKAQLERFFAGKELANPEVELLDAELLERMKSYVEERYAHILAVVPDSDETVVYDANQCREIFERALEVAGLAEKGWEAVVNHKKSNPATGKNKISLPGKMARTSSQLKRLIIHEMEVHARRNQNGKDAGSKLLEKGTADYADVEEGLGVLLECVLAGNVDNPSFHRARDRYITAGLALGAGDPPRDARQTFEVMWRLFAVRNAVDGAITDEIRSSAMDQAYVHVENAFRGTNFAMPGIIYSKLKIYYEGLQKNAQFFRDGIDNLDEAFGIAMVGKYNHTDEDEVERVMALAA